MPKKPTFTIITATYNAAQTLPKLLESLAGQSCRDFELFIQDGASTDSTMQVVESFRASLPALYAESAPDTGIYDAWNKVLPRINGEWALFLGADDFFVSNHSLEHAASALKGVPEHIDYAASPVVLVAPGGTPLEVQFPSRAPQKDLHKGTPLPHQGLFHNTRLFAGAKFDQAYKIAGDYDFLCATLAENNVTFIQRVISCMSIGGLSGNPGGIYDTTREFIAIWKKRFGKPAPYVLRKRLFLARIYKVLGRLVGKKTGARLIDIYRIARGKPALWSEWRNNAAATLPIIEKNGNYAPKFSLLVATYGRLEPVRDFFESLRTQSYTNFEVLVADQNPPEFLRELCEHYRQFFEIKRVVMEQPGVSAARNALIPLAVGDIIAFPDDDCMYLPDTMSAAATVFENMPHIQGVVATWVKNKSGSEAQLDATSMSCMDIMAAFKNANTYLLFFKKSMVEQIGMFDPALGPGGNGPYTASEDVDYMARAIKAGFACARSGMIGIYHPPVNVLDIAKTDKVRDYSASKMYLLQKYKLPLWFQLANIAYPLLRLPLEGPKYAGYRFGMFKWRVKTFFALRKKG